MGGRCLLSPLDAVVSASAVVTNDGKAS